MSFPTNLKELIGSVREHIFETRDSVCLERARLVTEAHRLFADEPAPIRRALAFAYILDHMTLDLESNPVFAGNTSSRIRGWMLMPEYGWGIPGQAVIENPRLAGLTDGEVIPEDLRAFWSGRSLGGDSGWGHLAVDNERLLSGGLRGVLVEIESFGAEGGDEAAIYRRAIAIACRGVIAWAQRYADAAERAGDETQDAFRAGLHRRVAQACRRVPEHPPRDLFEALQSLLLVHLALHIEGNGYSVSIGLLDQLLAPYGDDPELMDLLTAWMLKLNANSVFGSHSKTQPLTIGGVDAAGKDRCNRATLAILRACQLAKVPDPTLFLRWHQNIDPQVKAVALSLLGSGLSFPLLVGDEETIAGLQNAGISRGDAADYVVIGCNELGIPGRLIWNSVFSGEIQALRTTVLSSCSRPSGDMAQFLEQVEATYERQLRQEIRHFLVRAYQTMKLAPMPFSSALMHGCIAVGSDHFFSGVPYLRLNLRTCGFTNVVNSLAAIDEVVFRRQSVSLAGLAEAMETNFVGNEALHAQILRAPKWGNDDERADRWAQAWLELRDRVRLRLEGEPGTPKMMFELVVRSLHHLEGQALGATPDGRLAGAPLADSVGAQMGTARSGVSALLNSVCKLQPRTFWGGGYNLNLTLPLAEWQDAPAQAVLSSMVDVFFSSGGQELQVNILNVEILRNAQVRPERYPDLMVRIAGFNARFIDLSPLEQEEMIHRAEAAA
jgi:formate C-acetyltransferase